MLRHALLVGATLVGFIGQARAQDDLALEAPPGAAAGKPTALVVLSTKGKGGPNLKATVTKFIEKPLKAEDLVILPFAKFKKAAKDVKIKPKDMYDPANAAAAGQAAGVNFVLIVEGLMEKVKEGKKTKKVFSANLSLIEVRSGDVVYTRAWALKGNKISKVDGAQMVTDIVRLLGPPPAAAPEVPAPVSDSPEPPPAPPAPDKPPPVVAEGDPAVDPLALPEPVASSVDVPPEAPPEAPPETSSEPAVVAPAPMVAQVEPAPAVAATVEPVPERRGRWRPGIHAVAGVLAMNRVARIRASNAPQTPPCYCTDQAGGQVVIFPAGYLAVELFPLAFGGDGGWIEGLGLHLEGYYTKVETIIDAGPPEERIQSDVWGGRGGLSYRIVFWDSPTAIDFRADVGLAYSAFPLRAGGFPGVRYFGQLYAGGMFTIPLFTEYVALVGGGDYKILMEPQGQTRQMGDSVKRHTAFTVMGGVRGVVGPVEIRLVFRYEKNEQRYNGVTQLDELSTQFTNAKLTDETLGGIGAVGVQF